MANVREWHSHVIVVPQHSSDSRFMGHVLEAIEIVNGSQNYFYLELDQVRRDLLPSKDELDWDTTKSQIEGQLLNGERVIFITDLPFEDNWFSHEEHRFAVITIADWENLFAPPSTSSYLVYQIAQALLAFAGNITERIERNIVHLDSIGCMMDQCDKKSDIKLGMVAGMICGNCRYGMSRFGVEPEGIVAIESILERARSLANGRDNHEQPRSAFIVMKFSKNDENEKAYTRGIKRGLKDAGIDIRRADSMMGTQIFDIVKEGVQKSRFVVVKADVESMNVYFELGLAVSLRKEILIVVEEENLNKIPSDLRNWRCLTYKKGGYRNLRKKVANWFLEFYHLSSDRL